MKRGKKIIILAHCLLNQNARVGGYATTSGAVADVVIPFINKGFGIIQLPCPETTACGLRRWEAVVEQYDNPGFRAHCREILQPLIYQLLEHKKMGHKLYAVLGIPNSPCCGTERTPSNKSWGGPLIGKHEIKPPTYIKSRGVFMDEFYNLCKQVKLNIRFLDVWETKDMFPEFQPAKVLAKIFKENKLNH